MTWHKLEITFLIVQQAQNINWCTQFTKIEDNGNKNDALSELCRTTARSLTKQIVCFQRNAHLSASIGLGQSTQVSVKQHAKFLICL